jgi:hypothetical protein
MRSPTTCIRSTSSSVICTPTNLSSIASISSTRSYIVEQSAAAGTAFGASDTLVKLVGVLDLSNGSIAGHVITL